MSKVYLVEGNCGEYSDHASWIVKGFSTREAAENLRDRLIEWTKENGVAEDTCTNHNYWNLKCPLDPNFQSSYTGTTYIVFESDYE